MPRRLLVVVSLAAAVFGNATVGFGQSAPTSTITTEMAYEFHVDRLRYTFENPSNFNTKFLVPHSFTQSYDASGSWVTARISYPIRGDRFITEFSLAPTRQASGSDFDTFHNPDGDVIVYGTDGDVKRHAFRLGHWSETQLFGLPWRVGYRYRRDESDFLPTDRIITHTLPVSEARSPTFGRETTISELHEIPIEVSRESAVAPAWMLRISGTVAPLVWGRLTTILPDKYPDRDIVFDGRAVGYGGGIELRRRGERTAVHVSVRYARTWSPSDAQQITLNTLVFAVAIQQ